MTLLYFTLVVVVVMAISMGGSYLQHRYYLRVVNRLAAGYRKSDYILASGIRKSRLRGAIVVIVLRRDNIRLAEQVMVMQGSTLFAHFRERPDLAGLLDDERLERCAPVVRAALEDALARGERILHPEAPPAAPVARKAGTLAFGRGKRSVHG